LKIFAIGDLHLGHAVDKPMDVFGARWKDHASRIAGNWEKAVGPDDLVLVPGDLSWAMRMEEAEEDLKWLERLPGRKIIIKGNHDYWWPSISRLRRRLEGTSVHALQYDSIAVGPVAVGGTRLWTFPDLSCYRDPLAETPYGGPPDETRCRGAPAEMPAESSGSSRPGAGAVVPEAARDQDEKIFARELGRLESSLRSMDPACRVRIAMTHFPPTGETGSETPVTKLLESCQIRLCAFGHLHSLDLPRGTWDFNLRGVRYVLASCDAINFRPCFLMEV